MLTIITKKRLKQLQKKENELGLLHLRISELHRWCSNLPVIEEITNYLLGQKSMDRARQTMFEHCPKMLSEYQGKPYRCKDENDPTRTNR